jgi:hypothetical protein
LPFVFCRFLLSSRFPFSFREVDPGCGWKTGDRRKTAVVGGAEPGCGLGAPDAGREAGLEHAEMDGMEGRRPRPVQMHRTMVLRRGGRDAALAARGYVAGLEVEGACEARL